MKKTSKTNKRDIATIALMKDLWVLVYADALTLCNFDAAKVASYTENFKGFIDPLSIDDICTNCDLIRTELTQHSRADHVWLPIGIINRPFGFHAVNLIASFPRKIKLHDTSELWQKSAEAWFETEMNHNFSFDPLIAEAMQEIITGWFSDWDDYVQGIYAPQHGPGTTAEGCTSIKEKYNWMFLPKKVVKELYLSGYCLARSMPVLDIELPAEQTFVSKRWDALRGISMEWAGMMWAQQGLMKALYAYIHWHPYLRKHINLISQRQNQEYARYASFMQTYCTCDYSSASDLIGARLVSTVFDKVPFKRLLMALRTKSARLGDKTTKLQKFAPMGNALSFPVESLVFGALCELSCRWAGVKPSWSVFGDDTIIPEQAFPHLEFLSQALNFKLNRDKSFVRSSFTESCGREYFNGEDVTPIYFRIQVSNLRNPVNADNFSAWIEMANSCFELGLTRTRKRLLSMLTTSYYGKQKQHIVPLYENAFDGIFVRHDACAVLVAEEGTSPQFVNWVPVLYGTRPVERIVRQALSRQVLVSTNINGDQALYDWFAQRTLEVKYEKEHNFEASLGLEKSYQKSLRRTGLKTRRWIAEY